MEKKKKIIIAAGAIFLIIVVVLGIWLFRNSSRVLPFSQEKIKRAYITNGNNGVVTELTGDALALIYNDLQDASPRHIKDEETSGWSYTIDFQVGDKTMGIEMISPTVWKISDKRYEVSKKTGDKVMKDISEIEK